MNQEDDKRYDEETLNNEKLIKDHEYDGIQELDNNMPPWLWVIFFATLLFSGIYIGRYHWFKDGPSQETEYSDEVALADSAKKKSADANFKIAMLTSPEDLAAGKELYAKNCIACHGAQGEGNAIGPNLTDKAWKNGCTIEAVNSAIANGVPGTAMAAWKTQLSPKSSLQLASYTLSLQGSNPPNAKAAEGPECK